MDEDDRLHRSDCKLSRRRGLLRRLLLQTLKDHAAGNPLPGLEPASWRVRSARFRAPAGVPFADVMDRYVRIDALQAAE